MPPIKRWFPVSHDINSDPEVWEMRHTFGEQSLAVWLQILSVCDRNDGEFRGDLDWIAYSLTPVWGSNSKRYNTEWRRNKIRMILEWMTNKGWIEALEGSIVVSNFTKYHRTREPNQRPPDLPDLTGPIKKPEPAKPVPVDKSKKAATENETQNLVALAVKIGGHDLAAQKQLCQWTISMIRRLDGEPPDRVAAVTRASLESFKAKIESGYEIRSVWALLDAIFKKERTKYIQGPENQAYKNAPIGQFGEILQRIAAGHVMRGGP